MCAAADEALEGDRAVMYMRLCMLTYTAHNCAVDVNSRSYPRAHSICAHIHACTRYMYDPGSLRQRQRTLRATATPPRPPASSSRRYSMPPGRRRAPTRLRSAHCSMHQRGRRCLANPAPRPRRRWWGAAGGCWSRRGIGRNVAGSLGRIRRGLIAVQIRASKRASRSSECVVHWDVCI